MLLSRKQLFSLVEEIFLSIDDQGVEILDSLALELPGSQVFDWHVTVPLNVSCSHNNVKFSDKYMVMGGAKEVGLMLSAKMFAKDESQLNRLDLQDAVGEVANMLADRVRTEINSEGSIGLPEALEKLQFDLLLEQSQIQIDVYGLSHKKPFYVAVIQCMRHKGES